MLVIGCGYGDYEQLGKSGDVKTLLAMLKSSDAEDRWNALRGLGLAAQYTRPSEHANPGHDPDQLVAAVDPVIAALHDEDGKVRSYAVFALRCIAEKVTDPMARERAVEALIGILEKRPGDLYALEQAAEGLAVVVKTEQIDTSLSARAQAALKRHREASGNAENRGNK
jgi:HEAT repeat protein